MKTNLYTLIALFGAKVIKALDVVHLEAPDAAELAEIMQADDSALNLASIVTVSSSADQEPTNLAET